MAEPASRADADAASAVRDLAVIIPLPRRSLLVRARAVVTGLFIVVATLLGTLVAFAARLVDNSGESVLVVARWWSRVLLWFAGVKVTVTWRTPLAPGGAFVFMANHLSSVDIWAVYAAFPFRLRMLAKKQLANVPVLGWGMRAGRFIFIDRGNAVAARRSIDEAKDRIRDGHNVLIFPEGTRSRDGRLARFKKGGFHLAMDAGVPIVPVSIQGSREAMPPGSLLLGPGHVQIVVGEPIPTAGLSDADRDALLEKVRGVIAAPLGEAAVAPLVRDLDVNT